MITKQTDTMNNLSGRILTTLPLTIWKLTIDNMKTKLGLVPVFHWQEGANYT